MKWKILGGVALVIIAAGIVMNLKDVRRYARMTRM